MERVHCVIGSLYLNCMQLNKILKSSKPQNVLKQLYQQKIQNTKSKLAEILQEDEVTPAKISNCRELCSEGESEMKANCVPLVAEQDD